MKYNYFFLKLRKYSVNVFCYVNATNCLDTNITYCINNITNTNIITNCNDKDRISTSCAVFQDIIWFRYASKTQSCWWIHNP